MAGRFKPVEALGRSFRFYLKDNKNKNNLISKAEFTGTIWDLLNSMKKKRPSLARSFGEFYMLCKQGVSSYA